MKKEKVVVLRNDYPFLDKENGNNNLCTSLLLPPPLFPKEASILITDTSFSIFTLLVDIKSALSSGGRVIVISEKFHSLLLASIFPELEFLESTDNLKLSDVIYKNVTFKMSEDGEKITESERKVLKNLEYGMSDRELASSLNISLRTVKRRKENLLRKTGLCSTSLLSIYALLSDYVS